MKLNLKSIKEFFTNPDKLIEYSKEHWTFLKFSILLFLAGIISGFNFWWSNFIIIFSPTVLTLITPMLLIGWLIFGLWIDMYLFSTWLILKLTLKSNRREEANVEGVIITKDNFLDRIKIISYCVLIPFIIYNICVALLVVIFYSIKATYAVVYLWSFGKYLLYAWVLSITLYSTRDINKQQRTKINIIILLCFFTTVLLSIVLTFYGEVVVAQTIISLI